MNIINNTIQNQSPFTITKEEFPRIIWKLLSIKSAIHLLHEKLIGLQKFDHDVLMTSSEVCGFCDVLDDAHGNLYSVIRQLEEKPDDELQEIGRQLRWYGNHAEFILNFLLPNYPDSVPIDISNVEYRCLGKIDLPSILLLIEEIIDGLNLHINSLEDLAERQVADQNNGTVRGYAVRQASDYDSIMTTRIKAIRPKFKVLYDKYIFPGGSQLLTDPKKLGKETEILRKKIWELQNQMPSGSEEGMDCRLAIDQLDFLIRLINARFEFRESDLITLSIIVDRAGHDFNRALDWLTPGDGGDLVDIVH